MIFEHRSYRTFLKEVLAQKQRENHRYSMRAMAQLLGCSVSLLSETLSGKANFSDSSLREIAQRLKLNKRETEYLCLLRDLESETNPEARESILKRLSKLNPRKAQMTDLTIDQFKQISDWHHSAILELLYLKDFDFSPDSVAKKIGIPKVEAELAIERLERLMLIERGGNGQYRRLNPALQIRSEVKSAALRKFYREMFERASLALDEQTPQQRWSGYETIPVSSEALPEIRQACDAFMDEILAIAQKYEAKDKVYHLMLHFFDLTKV